MCELELKIDGETRQKDITGNMLYKIDEQVDYLVSNGMTINEGDLLLSGTPEGISNVSPGNILEATLKYQGDLIAEIK